MMFLCFCCIWQAVCDGMFSLVTLLNRRACYWLQRCRGRSLEERSVLQGVYRHRNLLHFWYCLIQYTKPSETLSCCDTTHSAHGSCLKIVLFWVNTLVNKCSSLNSNIKLYIYSTVQKFFFKKTLSVHKGCITVQLQYSETGNFTNFSGL